MRRLQLLMCKQFIWRWIGNTLGEVSIGVWPKVPLSGPGLCGSREKHIPVFCLENRNKIASLNVNVWSVQPPIILCIILLFTANSIRTQPIEEWQIHVWFSQRALWRWTLTFTQRNHLDWWSCLKNAYRRWPPLSRVWEPSSPIKDDLLTENWASLLNIDYKIWSQKEEFGRDKWEPKGHISSNIRLDLSD